MASDAPTKTRIIRIVHRENVPWLLANGILSRSEAKWDPSYRNIGNAELIDRRTRRPVPIAPFGVLSDYVPFYFCTHSVMLYNTHTRRVEGVSCPQSEIVHLVSSIERLAELGLQVIFTDRHALVQNAAFFSRPDELSRLDWPLLRSRDFKRDPEDPEKLERRQAECLVHRALPVTALQGVVCENDEVTRFCAATAKANDLELPVVTRVKWYF